MDEDNAKIAPVRLQVLVSTYAAEGLQRWAETHPPMVDGVEYIVSIQAAPAQILMPDSLNGREDIHIYRAEGVGVSRNRNSARSLANAPLCLTADDDVVYTPQSLTALIEAFDAYPQADIIICTHTCRGKHISPTPVAPTPLAEAPKGWYATSFEIAFRLHSPAGNTAFNENFGIGAPIFQAGEEDIWLHTAMRAGAKTLLLPLDICAHDHDTTTEKCGAKPWFVMTQGAIHRTIHPGTWWLRIVRHAMRQRRMPALKYIMLAYKGAHIARNIRKV